MRYLLTPNNLSIYFGDKDFHFSKEDSEYSQIKNILFNESADNTKRIEVAAILFPEVAEDVQACMIAAFELLESEQKELPL